MYEEFSKICKTREIVNLYELQFLQLQKLNLHANDYNITNNNAMWS